VRVLLVELLPMGGGLGLRLAFLAEHLALFLLLE
jgi:hypothetical protein